MRRLLAFLVCLFGILLPWRLRILYAECLGWMAQGVYWLYSMILGIIVRNLKKEEEPG